MKDVDVHSIDISQYVSARSTLPGKSAADAATINLQDHPVVVSASAGAAATARTEQAEARMYYSVSILAVIVIIHKCGIVIRSVTSVCSISNF